MDILSSNKKMASGGRGVIIHVIDTGCALVGELRGVKIVPFRGEPIGSGSSGALVLGSKPKINYAPTRAHGTMMCSVAHRQAPEAEIWSYNALPTEAEGYVNEALAYIVGVVKSDTAHRHIITMSLAGEADDIESAASTMHNLIRQLVALNAMVVVAAGNDGGQRLNQYPSCFQEPVTVSALNNDGTLAKFSTWHNEVDFAELGKNVPCIDMDGKETVCDGTSPATQDLGAKMACIWSRDLSMTEAEVYETAKAAALDLGASGRDPLTGWGWIATVGATPSTSKIPAFTAWLKKQVGHIYMWGGQGEKASEALIKRRETSTKNANRAIALYRKRKAEGMNPILAYDCSGLGMKWLLDNYVLPDDLTAAGMYSKCAKISRANLRKGDFVFRYGLSGGKWKIHHVGYVVDDALNIVEAMGRDDGVVMRPLNASGSGYWNRYGRLGVLK